MSIVKFYYDNLSHPKVFFIKIKSILSSHAAQNRYHQEVSLLHFVLQPAHSPQLLKGLFSQLSQEKAGEVQSKHVKSRDVEEQ